MLQNKDISDFSGFKTQASARYFVEFNGTNIDELLEAIHCTNVQKLPILIVSGGKNSLFAFDTYEGLVIHNNSSGYELIGHTLSVYSGHSLWELAESLIQQGKDVWQRFLGLPGSVGGAVFGNAGCFGLEIGPYVREAQILDMTTGQIFTLSGEDFHFSYRWSECKNHPEWFIIRLTFNLEMLIEKYASQENPLFWREIHQPTGLSCGSFFKNPSRERSAGSLIESVGLKGYHLGGAYFSDIHANFLMSDGTAHWKDLVDLKNLAQNKIFESTNITLVPEVRIVEG